MVMMAEWTVNSSDSYGNIIISSKAECAKQNIIVIC